MRPFWMCFLAAIAMTMASCCCFCDWAITPMPALVGKSSAEARQMINVRLGPDPSYSFYDAQGNELAYDKAVHGACTVVRQEPAVGAPTTMSVRLYLDVSLAPPKAAPLRTAPPLMPNVVGKTCSVALEMINNVAGPDPDYKFYDVLKGNAEIVYDEAEHGLWTVDSHEPPAGQPIGSLVRLYIRTPRQDPIKGGGRE